MEDNNTLSVESIVMIASEIGAKAAAKQFRQEGVRLMKEAELKDKQRQKDKWLHDTKRLMTHYREIKLHARDAISTLSEMMSEDSDEFFEMLMDPRKEVSVEAIVRSKSQSRCILSHIDAMLKTYEEIAYASNRAEEIRKYKILKALCIDDPPSTVQELAEQEQIHERTVYKDLDQACKNMSVLLFGVLWLDS